MLIVAKHPNGSSWFLGEPLQVTVRPMLWDRCLSVCNVGVLWPNGWIDQGDTWYWGRRRPGDIVLDRDPAPPRKEAQKPPLLVPCLLWPISATAELLLAWELMYTVYRGQLLCIRSGSGKMPMHFSSNQQLLKACTSTENFRLSLCHGWPSQQLPSSCC